MSQDGLGSYPYRTWYVLGTYHELGFCMIISSCIYRFTPCFFGGSLRITTSRGFIMFLRMLIMYDVYPKSETKKNSYIYLLMNFFSRASASSLEKIFMESLFEEIWLLFYFPCHIFVFPRRTFYHIFFVKVKLLFIMLHPEASLFYYVSVNILVHTLIVLWYLHTIFTLVDINTNFFTFPFVSCYKTVIFG